MLRRRAGRSNARVERRPDRLFPPASGDMRRGSGRRPAASPARRGRPPPQPRAAGRRQPDPREESPVRADRGRRRDEPPGPPAAVEGVNRTPGAGGAKAPSARLDPTRQARAPSGGAARDLDRLVRIDHVTRTSQEGKGRSEAVGEPISEGVGPRRSPLGPAARGRPATRPGPAGCGLVRSSGWYAPARPADAAARLSPARAAGARDPAVPNRHTPRFTPESGTRVAPPAKACQGAEASWGRLVAP
jgi:hypothetical protein